MKWGVAAFGGLALYASPARADEAPKIVVDMYEVAPGCPDGHAFREEIGRRTHARSDPEGRGAPPGKTAIQVKVYVARATAGLEGTIDVVNAEGARSTRRVASPRCEEIVSAFALVVALAIDDATTPSPEPPPPARPPPSEVTPVVAPSVFDPTPPMAPHHDVIVLRAGTGVAVQGGVSPNAVFSVPVFVELSREHGHPGFHVEPRARLAWTFATSDRESIAAGTATLHWTAGALDLCPVRLAFVTLGERSLADLRACGRLELGVLAGTGDAVPGGLPARSDHRLWAAAGVPLTFRIELTKLIFLELEGAARIPLVRDKFTVGFAESLVFRPPVVGEDVGIGGGIVFR